MERDIPENGHPSNGQALEHLERQVERGSLFTHTIVSRNAERIHETESFLYGMIDLLIEKGMVTPEELEQGAGKVRQEMDAKGQTLGPGIALRVEGEGARPDDFTPVNCEERLPICKAICCRLHFALTAEEVEAGHVKWDLGAPYYIRQDAAGCCTHLDHQRNGCSVYADRPGICRRYSCANDERIWTDFDNMILNEGWIAENLHGSKPRLYALQMLPEAAVYASPKSTPPAAPGTVPAPQAE